MRTQAWPKYLTRTSSPKYWGLFLRGASVLKKLSKIACWDGSTSRLFDTSLNEPARVRIDEIISSCGGEKSTDAKCAPGAPTRGVVIKNFLSESLVCERQIS